MLGLSVKNLIDAVCVVEVPFGPSDTGGVSPREPDDGATDDALDRELLCLRFPATDLACVFLHVSCQAL